MNKFLIPAAFASALLLTGCQSSVALSGGGPANPADLAFVTNADQVIMFARAEGKFAGSEAERPEVRNLAQSLVQQSNALDAKLQPVTSQLNIKNPDIMRRDLRIRIFHVLFQHGLDFDQTYVEDQLSNHEVALAALGPVSDTSPPLTPVATQGKETISQNAARLQALQNQMALSPR